MIAQTENKTTLEKNQEKRKSKFSNKLENNKTAVRLISFLLAIVPTSIAVSFASFIGNDYLLAIALFPTIITLSFSIVPVPIPAKVTLSVGILSFVASVTIICYTLVAHADLLKPYLKFPF